MNDPKQLAVLKKLTTLLEGINPTNVDPKWALNGEAPQNYTIDLRGKVFRGKTEFGQEVALPAFSLLEALVPLPANAVGDGRLKRGDWQLLLQGFAENDMANPADPAYYLKAAAELRLSRVIAQREQSSQALFPDDFMLGNMITGLIIGQGVVRPPDKNVSTTAFFYIPLVVEMVTNTGNPYAA